MSIYNEPNASQDHIA